MMLLLYCFALLAVGESAVVDLLSCDFEEATYEDRLHYCNYYPHVTSRTQDYNFTIVDGNLTRENDDLMTGPLGGVLNSGNYIQVVPNRLHYMVAPRVALTTPLVPLSGPHCVSLDYFIGTEKSKISILANFQTNTNFREAFYVFSRSGFDGVVDRWQHYGKTVNFTDGEYFMYLEAEDMVAFDNLKFETGPCPNSEPDVKLCNFDAVQFPPAARYNGIACDWLTPVSRRPNQWWINQGSSVADGGKDHSTYHQGNYLVAPAEGELLTSELVLGSAMPEDGVSCVSWWMKSNKATWRVVEHGLEDGVDFTLLQSDDIEFKMESEWFYKQIEIDPIVPISVSLKVSNETHPSFQNARGSFLYLDDFKKIPGKCPKQGSCGFKKDLCGYTTVYNRRMDPLNIGFGRARKAEAVLNSPRDRNVNISVPYAYVDFSRYDHSFRARIVSDLISGSGIYCVRLEYFAQLVDSITSNVWFQQHFENEFASRSDVLARQLDVATPINRRWNQVSFDIHVKQVQSFKYGLEILSRGKSSIFELNSISVDKGPCGKRSNHTFQEVRFHCYKSGHYIPQHQSCDGVIDCPMGEDEEENCSNHDCSEGGILCSIRNHKFCLNDASLYCNSEINCADGVDEDPRLCNRDHFCENYCLNDGICRHGDGEYDCKCEHPFSGKRCQSGN